MQDLSIYFSHVCLLQETQLMFLWETSYVHLFSILMSFLECSAIVIGEVKWQQRLLLKKGYLKKMDFWYEDKMND